MTATTVDVWLIDTDLPAPALARLQALLDGDERRRLDTIAAASRRRRFVAAHGALRVIVGDRLGIPPQRLAWRRGRHGKPELAEPAAPAEPAQRVEPAQPAEPARPAAVLQVNLSHSGDLALVAVADRRPVGVDIQRLPLRLDPLRLAARYFRDPETRYVAEAADPAVRAERFAQLWARKEACVKAAGGRLAHGLTLPVHPAGADTGGPDGAGVLVRDPVGALPGDYVVRDVPAPDGFRAAVALAGADCYEVRRHRWAGAA